MTDFELGILDAIQGIKCDFLDKVMVGFSFICEIGWIWILFAIIMLCFKKYRKNGIILICTLLMGLLIANLILKNSVARIRPYEYRPAIELLTGKMKDWSFPSGHATASFGSATAIWYANKKWGIAAYILASIIAFSRMYLYVHFPTDILGGIAVGIVSFIIVKFIYNFVEKKIAEKMLN